MSMTETATADLLIVNGDIVTMDKDRRILNGGAIAIAGERILEVGSTTALKAKFPQARIVDANGGVIHPGMVNGHQHLTGGVLIKSCVPDDWPSVRSIPNNIPIHQAQTGDTEELSATLSAVGSALNGVTMVIEAGSVNFPARLADGVRKVGIRATTGIWGTTQPGRPHSGPADEVLARQEAVLQEFPPGGLVTGWVTLVGHSMVNDELMAGGADLARKYGVGMTMHMSPIKDDPDSYLARFNRRPIEHLDDIGVLGRHLLIGHGVWLDEAEVELMLESESAIAYCPWAYFRLGQGTSVMGKHAEIFLRGGRIALGCDAVNAGDQVDILRQATLAAGLAKDKKVDPSWFGAHEVLEMATIRGAEAIGMDHLIGSIEAGKMADIVIHDSDNANWIPKGDPIIQLVWGTDGRSVRDVFVGGKDIVRGGRCVTVDLLELKLTAAEAAAALFAKTGIVYPNRWPHIAAV
ncbi:MAG: putative hydrolase [Phenylobacterium sp.]|nr:putative hydrolase [Phenylobacterium sp.]